MTQKENWLHKFEQVKEIGWKNIRWDRTHPLYSWLRYQDLHSEGGSMDEYKVTALDTLPGWTNRRYERVDRMLKVMMATPKKPV